MNKNLSTVMIETSLIKKNPKNSLLESVTDSSAISLMKESLNKNGLMQPLIVYKDNSKYMLISGFKRFEAIKKLKWEKIPCIVVDKPETDEDENIAMLHANQYRTSKEDVDALITTAERVWETLSKEAKNEYREKYKKAYEAKYKERDPELIHFSPKTDFIRETTGITLSSRTIANKRTELKKENTDKKPKEDKGSSSKSSTKKLLNTLSKTDALLGDYATNVVNEVVEKELSLKIATLQVQIGEVIAALHDRE